MENSKTKLNNLLFFIIILTFLSLQLNAQRCMEVGMNFDGGNNSLMFNDMFKFGRAFKAQEGANGMAESYTVNMLTNLVTGAYSDVRFDHFKLMEEQGLTNADGYPVSIPVTLRDHEDTRDIVITEMERWYDLPKNYPNGNATQPWVLKWKGTGEVGLRYVTAIHDDDDVVSSSLSGQWARATSDGEGRLGVEIGTNGSIKRLKIYSSNSADPIRDIRLIYPGLEADFDAGQRFHPRFLEVMEPFNTIRFMDYFRANSAGRSWTSSESVFYEDFLKEQEWEERIGENYYLQSTNYGGAHEHAIALCNQTMSNAWINIPFSASLDYVREMAQLYKDNLNPDLTLYIEVGNELWNFAGGFIGYYWMSGIIERMYPGLDGFGARIGEVMAAWTEVFGEKDMERVIRCVGFQSGYTYLNNLTVKSVGEENWDAAAVTWYFGLSDQDKDDLEVYYNSGVSQDQFSQEFANKVIEKFRLKTGYNDFDLAASYGKEVVTYEGGTHAISGNEFSGGFLQAQVAANQTPYYYDVYEEVMDSIENWGITLAMHYKFVGGGGGWGYWGAQENIFMDPYLDGQYKMQSLLDRINTNNCGGGPIASNEIGPGNALRFDGRNDFINADEVSFKPDDNGNYTYEVWFSPVTLNENQVILSFSNTTGNDNFNLLQIRADNRVNWKIGNGGALNINLVGNQLINAKQWYHVAAVKNGNRYTLYLNGEDVSSVNYTSATISRSAFTVGGMRNSSGFTNPINGEMDEVKVWNTALTVAEIREYMCEKVTTSHPKWSNLQTYFRFDTTDYTNHRVLDQKSTSAKGTINNMSYANTRSGYLLSGAPVGDDSKTLYPTSWAGAGLNYQHTDGDLLAVSNIGNGNPDGIHIYLVNNAPVLNESPILKGTTTMYEGNSDEKYYGVFVANGSNPNYDLTYMYAGHPDAYSGDDEKKHRLIRRENSGDLDWIHSGAKLEDISNTLTLNCREQGRGEYNLAFRNNLSSVMSGSGNALHFDNAYQRAVVKNTRVDDFTITAWIKGFGGVYNLTGFSNRGEEIFSVGHNLSYRLSTPDLAVQGFDGSSVFKITDSDEWYHLAVTREGTQVKAYVNGILNTEKDFIGTNKVEEFYFGFRRNPELLKHPDIVLDEIAVFDIATDQETIREWMCKKITADHPYECENLRLYFNLDQGQGTIIEDTRGPNDMVLVNIDGAGGSLPSWVVSGAPIGDVSINEYVNLDNVSMSHPDGDHLDVSFNGDHVNAVHMYRIDNIVPNSINTDNGGIQTIDESRYWGLYVYKPYDKNASYDVTYNYEDNSSIAIENEIRLMERTENSTNTWQSNFGVTPNTGSKTISLTNKYREEFILGGTSTNTFAASVAPATPLFETETATINQSIICSNGASLVYKVIPDPFAVSYVWTLPPGLEGFSTSDSIVITASGDIGNVDIGVEAVNRYGVSALATYSVNIISAPTLSDAGPNQMLLPPSTSTNLDGNAVSSGETGTWTAIPDTVGIIIATINDEKTGVSGLVSGYNQFAWTIENGVCPPNTDTTVILVAPPPTDVFVDVTGDLPSEFCSGTVITLTALPWENVTPDGYAWYLPDGMTVLSENAAEVNIQLSNGIGGAIEVAAVYNGQESELYTTKLINIRQEPVKPIFVDYADTLCLGSLTDFSVALDASTTHYEWTIAEGIYPTEFPKSTTFEINLEALDVSEGWIKVKGFNGICSHANAVDSVYAVVMSAPPMPRVGAGSAGNSSSWQAACHGSNAILWVRDDGADNYNWWVTDDRVDIVEITGSNNQLAVFDFNNITSQFKVYVTATFGTGKCNTSPPNRWNLWPRSEPWYDAGNITVTNPPSQNPMALNVGSQYDLQVSQGAANGYFWLYPDGTSVFSGSHRLQDININVDYDFTDTIKVYAVTTAACTGEPARLLLSTGVFAPPPQYVSGDIEFCQGSNLNITVSDLSSFGVTEYRWIMPDGTVYNTSTNVINQQINDLLIGTVTVEAINSGGTSQPGSFEIRTLGNPIGEITFVDDYNDPIDKFEVCEGDRKYIRIRDVGASEYVWDIEGKYGFIMWIPEDAGNGYRTDPKSSGIDTIIQINYTYWMVNDPPDPNEGWIHIEARNPACGQVRRDSIFYELTVPVDRRLPLFLEEPSEICAGSSVTYRVDELDAADQYIWSLPTGLTSGSIVTSIPEITVDVAQGAGGTISVYATSPACGGSTSPTAVSNTITIHGAPLDFEFLEAPLAGCSGDDITFTVNDVGSSEYTWTIPDGLSPNIQGKSIVLDEDDPQVTMSGTWTTNTDARSVEGDIMQTGEKDINTWIRYTPDLPYTGTYNVYMSYPWGTAGQYNADVPVEVNHMSYIEEFRMNQSVQPTYDGQYWYLGTWDFEKGTSSGYVEIVTEDAYQYRTIRADAVKFELVSKFVVTDTSITFEALGGDIGAVCVTAQSDMCASGYTICTDPVNTGQDMGSPTFMAQVSAVCEGLDYDFSVSDIGADTYTWILPTGMSIGGQIGTITGLTREETVTMDLNTGSPVQIGVSGVINSCGVIGDTVYTNDIDFTGSGCQLSDPVFILVEDTTCIGLDLIFTVLPVTDAEQYQWVLPIGVQQSGTTLPGIVNTIEPTITVTTKDSGELGVISVTAMAPSAGIASSNQVSTANPIVVVLVPDFNVSTIDLSSCTSTDGLISLSGLGTFTSYSLTYSHEGTLQGPFSFTTDATGVYNFADMAGGEYTMFVISMGACLNTNPGTYNINATVPVVSLGLLPSLCANDTAHTLSGGLPLGGSYRGTGVSLGKFDPVLAGEGDHIITYEYSEGAGCTNSVTSTITVNPLPSGSLQTDDSDNIICIGTAVTYTANDADSFVFTLNGLEIENNTTGIYINPNPVDGDIIGVEATLNSCATNYAETTISVVPLPIGSLFSSHDTICEGVEVSFTASGGDSYNFMINDIVATSTTPNTLVTSILYNGDVITAEIIDVNACSSMADDTIVMEIIPAPLTSILGAIDLCPGIVGELYEASDLPNVLYEWSVTGEDNYLEIDYRHLEIDWGTGLEGTINLTLLDTTTECSSVSSLNITLFDEGAPVILNCPESFKVEAEIENGIWHYLIKDEDVIIPTVQEDCESTGYTLSFSLNGDLPDDQENIVGTELLDSENEIIWTAKDFTNNESEECIVEISMIVNEKVPAAFSPNGDGVNDTWEMPFLQMYDDCVVKVFNRQGRIVFESDRGYTQPWDGSSFGKRLAVDSYHYIIITNDEKHPKKGTITILR